MFEELRSELTLSASDYIRESEKAERASDDLADSTERLDEQASTASEGMSDLRKGVGAAGAALAGGGALGLGAAAKSFASFDEKMQESISIMSDVSDAERQKLEQTARDVAKSTTKSHEESANSLYYLSSAGLDAASSMEALPQVAKLSEAGAIDMAKASDYATDIMSAFGKEAKDLGEITDTMTATVSRGNTDMNQLGEAMSYVAPVASGMGVSLQETSASIQTLSNAGIKGSKAGTTLRQALSKLSNPTKKMQEKLNELGVSVKDSQGNMRDFSTILTDLKEAGADTSDIMEMFGARAGPGIQVLLEKGGQAIDKEAKKLKSMEGVTEEVAKTQKQTLNKQLDVLKSRIIDIGVATGQYLEPSLKTIVGALTDAVNWFSELNDATSGAAGALAGIGAVVGGLGVSLAAFWPIISSSVVPALSTMGAVLGGLSAPFLAIASLVGVVGAAFTQNFGGIRDTTMAVVDTLREQFLAVWSELKATVLPILSQIANAWQGQGARIESVASGMFETIAERLLPIIQRLGTRATQAITWISGMWTKHGEEILSVVRLISTNLSEMLIQAMAAVSSLVQGDLTQMVSSFQQFKSAALNIWNALWPRFVSAARTAFSMLVREASKAFDWLTDELPTKIADGINAAIDWVHSTAIALAEQAFDALGAVAEQALNAWAFVRDDVVPPIRTALSKAWSWLRTEGVALATGAFEFLAEQALNAWAFVRDDVVKPVQTALSKAWSWVKTEGVSTAVSAVETMVGGVITTLQAGLRGGIDQVLYRVVGLFAKIFGRLKGMSSGQIAGLVAEWQLGFQGILDTVREKLSAAWSWVKTKGVSLARQAIGQLVSAALTAWEFTRENVVPPVRDALSKVWTWLRNNAPGIAKGAFEFLVSQALTAWEFVREDVVSPIQTALGKAWSWLRTEGVTLGKAALGFLVTQALTAWEWTRENVVAPLRTGLSKAWSWLRNNAPGLAKAAFGVLVTQALNAWEFTRENVVPPVQTALSKVWTWLRTEGVTLGKAALGFLATQALTAWKWTRENVVPPVQNALSKVWTWLRTEGASLAKEALNTLIDKGTTALKNLKLKQKFDSAVQTAVSWIKTEGLSMFKGAFQTLGRKLMDAVVGYLDLVPKVWNVVIPAARDWLKTNGLSAFKTGFRAIVRGVKNLLLSAFAIPGMVGQAIVSTINGIRDWLSDGGAEKLKNGFMNIVSGIVSYLKNEAWSDLKGAAEFLFDAIIAAAEILYEELIGGSIIPDLISDITTAFENWDIVGTIADILGSVFDEFATLASDVITGGDSTIDNLISSVTSAFTDWDIVETIGNILSSIGEAFVSLATDVITGGDSTIDNLISSVTSAFTDWDIAEDVAGVLSDVLDKFSSFATDIIGDDGIIKTLISDIVSYLKNDAKSDLKSAAKKAFDSMASAAKTAFNEALPDKIPEITIGGEDIPFTDKKVPSVTVGGQSLDALELATGGFIKDTGLAMLHEGEYVLNESQVDRAPTPATAATTTGGSTTEITQQLVIEEGAIQGVEDPEAVGDVIEQRFERLQRKVEAESGS